MTKIYVDATTLIALGTINELELLTCFDGEIRIPDAVVQEVTTEPATTSLDQFIAGGEPRIPTVVPNDELATAQEILGEDEPNGDSHLLAAVLADDDVAVVSDDQRVRTTAQTLGANVTGTIGVIVRAVEDGLPPAEAKELVRRIDGHGLHMTGELREKALELIDDAGET